MIALFGVQSIATAGEESNNESSPSIDWGLSDPWSSVSALSSASTQADTDKQLSKDGTRVAMFRFYNKWTGEHFYTASITEKNNIEKAGWSYEEVGWYAPTDTNLKPVYRLYNPYVEGGDHHYTKNATEKDNCVKQGWKYEGIAWYTVEASTAAENDEADVYRQYNPNAVTGTHNYTMSKEENDSLVKAGWKAEGTAWRGYSKIEASPTALDFSKISVTTTAKTYNGKAQTQTVKSSAYKLNTDYTVTYLNNKNAGTATIVVKGKGNFTGSKTYTFKINKATPVCKAPTGLAGIVGNALSTVDIASSTVNGNTPGGFAWADGTKTMSDPGEKEFMATFTPTDTKNYLTVANVKVKVTVLTEPATYNITFDVNAPSGVSAAIYEEEDSDIRYNTLTKTIECDDTTPTTHKLEGGDFPATVKNNTTGSKYVFAGWSKNKSDVVAKGNTTIKTAADLIADATTVSSDETYYAIWMESTGYWLGTKNASERYESEAYFLMHDQNYVDSATIDSDMSALHVDSASEAYLTSKAKWDNYYKYADSATAGAGNQVRLYASYNVRSWVSTEILDKFVEFRILEVSGADGHKLSDGTTSDGSAVTFIATHFLPEGSVMRYSGYSSNYNWENCYLYEDMNNVNGSAGSILTSFSTDFVSRVRSITKEYHTGGSGCSQTSTPGTIDCQFWIPSYTELVNKDASDYPSEMPKLEGTQYAWCATNVKNAYAANSCLAYTTRAGEGPFRWWLRSPVVGARESFGIVNEGGDPGNHEDSFQNSGVVPAFAF